MMMNFAQVTQWLSVFGDQVSEENKDEAQNYQEVKASRQRCKSCRGDPLYS